MSVATYDRPAGYRIGRVFGDTFGVLGRNMGLCIGLAAIFAALPSFIFQLLAGFETLAAIEEGTPQPPSFDAASVLGGIVAFLVYLAFYSIMQAALVRVTIEDLNGRKSTFAAALNRGIALILPIVGLTVVAYLGMVVGFILLIVPGVYLMVRWSAALPALVHEQRGVLESLKRSSDLTKGNRWRVFALWLVIMISLGVLQYIVGLLTLAILPMVGVVIATAIAVLPAAALSAVISIAMTVSYVELRYVKEGADVNELAEIFA